MSVGIAAIVLCAALLHALWNALVKGAGDRTVMLGLVALGHAVPGFALALNLPAPDRASWIFVIASTVIHWGYYYTLNLSYRTGDLSIVYPVARGAAPLMVALTAWLVLGEALPLAAWLGIITISGGIVMLSGLWRRGGTGAQGLWPALATALTIAAYSIADGVGVRLSGSSLAYVAWLFTAEISIAVVLLAPRMDRLRAMGGRAVATGLAGGVVSATAYAMVLYAKTQAPLGMVSAMRETSVIFAALFGIYMLGEGPRRPRLLSAAVVCLGVILIALA